MDLLLIGCGFVSAIPQLGLSLGIRSVPMISLGIMQYILPTTVFMLGAFVMREPISASKLLVFLFIWVGVGCFLSGTVFSTGRKKLRQVTEIGRVKCALVEDTGDGRGSGGNRSMPQYAKKEKTILPVAFSFFVFTPGFPARRSHVRRR